MKPFSHQTDSKRPAFIDSDKNPRPGLLVSNLSLVLPLYNEERCLENNFEAIKAYLDDLGGDYEIILVNDGSMDSTPSIIENIVRDNPQATWINCAENRGKGYAVKSGILNATRKYVVFTDADLAVPVRFIEPCLKHLHAGSPVVIGSRHLPDSAFKIRESFIRRFLGEIFRTVVRFGLGLRVSDITCGLKGFERNAAVDIFSRSKIDKWGCDAEILFLARRLGYGISEIPVDWYHSFDSKVKVGSATVKTLMEMFQIGRNYVTKRYNL